MNFKSDFLREINSRGFIYQSSDIDSLDELMSKKKITAYIGFDITSDSLHIGSLVQLMLLNWLDDFGHKAIALVGGGTTLVGDPSGKDATRKIMTLSQISENIDKDNIASFDSSKILAEKLQKQKKVDIKFKAIKGADHFYENYSEEFSNIVDSYIKDSLKS